MAKIIAVRHAESIANTCSVYQGQSYDTGLSKLGEKQAEALAERLLDFDVQKIISSPLIRTISTAEKISYRVQKRIIVNRQIIETGHGFWEGKSKIWVQKNYPNIFNKWQKLPCETVFPNGEAFRETVARVENFIKLEKWQDKTVLVTHDNIIRIMICLAKDRPINTMWNIKLEPASISLFELRVNGKKELKLITSNIIGHLNGLRANLLAHAL